MAKKRSSRKSRQSKEEQPVASGHTLRARRTAVSYKEYDDDYDVYLDGTNDSDEVEDDLESSQVPASEGATSGIESDPIDDNSETETSLARNVKLRLPKKRSAKISDEEDDDDLNNEDAHDNGKIENDDDDDDDDEVISNTRRSRTRRSTRNTEVMEDDEYVASEDESIGSELDSLQDDDNNRVKDFIASDDDDYVRPRKKRRSARKKSGRTQRKLSRKTDPEDSDESYKEENEDDADFIDNDSIKDELEELKSSQEASPPRKHLRERNKNINYQLPPPITDGNLEDAFNISATSNSGRKSFPKLSAGINKGLFSVAGPFGGNDIIPIFGNNAPAANIIAPFNTFSNDSSSSDDDDFATRSLDPSSGAVNAVSNNKSLITSDPFNKKKKSSLADNEPITVDSSIDFNSVGGLDNYINQLKEMVALPLLYPEVFDKFKIQPPRGVLFHGPPGTGKTLMARALAASCSTKDRKITFFMRKGADCLSKWVGEAERQLRLLFEEAKNKQPSIIFFDEIDGLAPVRSSKQEQIHASIVSTLLALMDGMVSRGQVIVIGATNRPDAIDPALRRPGRFDREFYFPLPDQNARNKIMEIHTNEWNPPLSKKLINKLGSLTKGYGGSDIKALCTEAALNSIKRRYPQIYESSKKLNINVDDIKVNENDFMNALDKIVPSTARSAANPSHPIPEHLEPLLNGNFEKIKKRLDKLITGKNKKIKNLIDLDDENSSDEEDSEKIQELALIDQFNINKHDLFKNFEVSRIFKPRLLVTGKPGMGQNYIGSAIIDYLEGFQVQSLDLGTIFSESGRTPEASIIQMFLEAKRNQPSVLYIPSFEIWLRSVPESAKSTLEGLMRSLNSSEKVLLLGVCELGYLSGSGNSVDDVLFENEISDSEEMTFYKSELKRFFGSASMNTYVMSTPSKSERTEFFKFLWIFLKTKPVFHRFNIDDENYIKYREIEDFKKNSKLEVLPVDVKPTEDELKEEEKATKREIKEQYKNDVKLKNLLKIKLSAIMEIFKTRYKRFKKPIIPLQQLAHLFEPSLLIPGISPSPQYVKDGNMILDTLTNKKYFNMELDTIEERLWNGYYSEPKQFLKDVEMIYLDAKTSGDRERSLKASEMFVNAQVSIEEMFMQDLLNQCKELRKREIIRQKEYQSKLSKLENRMVDVPVGDKEAAAITGGEDPKTTSNEDSKIIIRAETDEKQVASEALMNDNTKKSSDTERISDSGKETSKDSKANGTSLEHTEMNKGNGTTCNLQADRGVEIENNREEASVISNGRHIEETLKSNFTPADIQMHDEYVRIMKEYKKKDLKLDSEYLEKVEKSLILKTDGLTIEQLELVNSSISEVIWNEKQDWDRNKVLKHVEKKLHSTLKSIKD